MLLGRSGITTCDTKTAHLRHMQRLIQVLQLCLQVVGLTYFNPLLGSPTFFLPLFTQVRGR